METYQELYFYLFRTTELALEAINKQNFGLAQEILIQGQQTAEESVLSDAFQSSIIQQS